MMEAPQLLNLYYLLQRLQDLHNLQALQLIHIQILRNRIERARARNPRSVWVKRWVGRREQQQPLHTMFRELSVEDPDNLRSFIRVDYDTFQFLVRRVGPRIQKAWTNFRRPISPVERMLLTLRFLCEGGIYRSKQFDSRTPHNTMSVIIKQVCDAIYDEFQEEYLSCPTTPRQWKAIANRFNERWNFPHTLGALDGKHVAIKCPPNSGSRYYNYKGFYSIVLMALVDADYKFIWVEVGSNGASSDGQIFNDSDLKECLLDGSLGIPADDKLPGDDQFTPYYFIGDDAFPINTWFMKPFSIRNMTREQRIFNYRLSRARRVVENAFGILAQRFGCLATTLRHRPETASSIVKACVILHNILRSRVPLAPGVVDEEDRDHHVVPGAWRRGTVMHDMDELTRGNLGTRQARRQRQYIAHYLDSEVGSVPWQDTIVDRE